MRECRAGRRCAAWLEAASPGAQVCRRCRGPGAGPGRACRTGVERQCDWKQAWGEPGSGSGDWCQWPPCGQSSLLF